MEQKTTLVVTLGGQPQVVTYLLDMLLEKKEPIQEVVVIVLPESEDNQKALKTLSKEFEGNRYNNRPIRFRYININLGSIPLGQVYAPAEVEIVRNTFKNLFEDLKGNRHTIHLGVSGGRRILAFVAITVAMQLFKLDDHIWHIYTPDEMQERARGGRIMHAAPEDGVHLIEVPFVPWVSLIPGLDQFFDRSNAELRTSRYGWLDDDETELCRLVLQDLTARQKDVLKEYAAGYERKEIATRLNLSPATIDSHRRAILRKCEEKWYNAGKEFHESDIVQLFGRYPDLN
ncbi:MAG: hypothetical protein CL609_15055 [Anaerolineaceae bacterium]|nr:hypothetical protein [Anaerolineaceae bacterium]